MLNSGTFAVGESKYECEITGVASPYGTVSVTTSDSTSSIEVTIVLVPWKKVIKFVCVEYKVLSKVVTDGCNWWF